VSSLSPPPHTHAAPTHRRLGALSLVALAAACGSNAAPGAHDSGGTSSEGGIKIEHYDAGHDAHTAASSDARSDVLPSTYPAFTVDAPQIAKNQGTVIASPVIVTVTWPGDPNASTWEAFGDGIGASTYWSMTTSPYGVGSSASGASNHIRMTQSLPASLSYTDLQTFVVSTVSAAEADAGAPDAGTSDAAAPDAGAPNPRWPLPTLDASGNDRTIYALYIPASTTVTDPGSGMSFCIEGGLGYHDDVVVNGKPITYAVTLECSSQTLPDLEETAAHETVEAATNPYPESMTLGYQGFDSNHLAWDLYTGFNDELADACQNWQTSYFQETGNFPYWVQSSWSNEAALAGHDPCVPHPAGPYHGMTLFPSEEASVSVPLAMIGAPAATTTGFKAVVGKAVTFQVGFFSDAPTGAPWTISYDFPSQLSLFDMSGNPIGNGAATVAIDKTTGQNGDTANVSVTVTTPGPAGFQLMAITWDPPTSIAFLPRYLPVVLVDP